MASEQLQFDLLVKYETLEGLKKALAEAKAELEKVAIGAGTASKEFIEQQSVVSNLSVTIKNYANLSAVQAQEMEKVWAALDKLNKQGAINQEIEFKRTQAINQNIAAMVQFSQVQRGVVTPAMGSLHSVSANAGQALLNLNYVIRDSPYFFNNFAMGVLAVGNNINPLIDRFAALRKEAIAMSVATGTTITSFQLLKAAMVGGAGISIAFSLIVTAIQAYVFSTARSNSATKNLTESMKELWSETYKTTRRWDEFVLSLDKMSKLDIIESLRAVNQETKDLRITFGDALLAGGRFNIMLRAYAHSLSELIIKRKELEAALRMKEEGTIGGGIIDEQQALVESYQILEKSAKIDSERLGWQKLRIQAQKQLNDLMGKGEKEAKDLLDEVIVSDKELIEALMKVDTLYKRTNLSVRESNLLLEERIELTNKLNIEGQKQLDLIIQTDIESADLEAEPLGDFRARLPVRAEFLGARGFREKLKEINTDLKVGKIVANELGDALSRAFMGAKASLEDFIKSIMVAIAQMLILKAIMAFLTGGMGGGAASAATPVPSLGKTSSLRRGSNTIQIEGKITADKNNFIALIRNADNYYSRNEEFILIGR